MSQHSGHTDSDGMISDMAEGSGRWRSEFPDDSDFGADGSGSGDGYSGELKILGLFVIVLYSFNCDAADVNALELFLSSPGLSKVPVPERPTYQPPVVVHNPRDNGSTGGGASSVQVQIVAFLAINLVSLLLLRSH